MLVASLVLAHVVICTGFLVGIICFKARIRQVLLIQTPADASLFQEIHDCLGAGRDVVSTVVSDPEGATTNSGHIVRLRRQREREGNSPLNLVDLTWEGWVMA